MIINLNRFNYIMQKNSNSFVFRKELSKVPSIYYIHDNYGRPFNVVVNKSSISIFADDHIGKNRCS